MARIKRITFDHFPDKHDGCICDRCGQWLCNVVNVTFTDGVTMHYGQDCFTKLRNTGNLSTYGKKLLKQAMDRVDYWQTELARYTGGEMTPETDKGWQNTQIDASWKDRDYWYGRPYEEYRQWMIEKVIPSRIADAQKEIGRFAKVDFAR